MLQRYVTFVLIIVQIFLNSELEIVNAELHQQETPSYSKLSLLTSLGNDLTEEPLERLIRTATFSGFSGAADIFVIPRKSKDKLIHSVCKILDKLSKSDDVPRVILYVETTSLILTSPTKILNAFKKSNARILLSQSQSRDGIPGTGHGHGFIGYTTDLIEVFGCSKPQEVQRPLASILEAVDDSRIKIDVDSKVFYTLSSSASLNNVSLSLSTTPNLKNTLTSQPVLILQQEGSSPSNLNWFGNYLTPTLPQDQHSEKETNGIVSSKTTTLTMALFLSRPTPFIEEFFNHILNLEFDKNRIHLFIYNQYKYHVDVVDQFLKTNGHQYASTQLIRSKERVKEWSARKLAVEAAIKNKSNYTLFVDSIAHLENPQMIQLLIRSNKPIISPLLCRPSNDPDGPRICNYYGAVDSDGVFQKASDYDEIVSAIKFGIWNVPFISGAYLIHSSILRDPKTRPNFISRLSEPEDAFCTNNRERGLFMHITNEWFGGTLVSADNFDFQHLNPELYTLFDNRGHWERRYLHPNFTQALEGELVEPCRDVFWFPIMTPRFASDFIEEMEAHGGWSDGSIQSKGDLYPTVEIDMDQIRYISHWNEIMRLYIKPLQEKAFPGYEVYPPTTNQAFVVKYSAKDQRELKPHFDDSTYTINIALNRVNVDYEGGGCRFLRDNCSVVDTRLGWMMMHPGQFTHKHEGLRVTSGVRYILVAFIDPPSDSA